MNRETVGVIHPGEMGVVVARAASAAGHRVLWMSRGRSKETAQRADAAGLEAVATLDDFASRCSVVVAVCPPSAAIDVAQTLPAFKGLYIDANGTSPATAGRIAQIVEQRGAEFVDGAIIGVPPASTSMGRQGAPRLYVGGPTAASVEGLFAAEILETRVIGAEWGKASALKMAYTVWAKGVVGLMLAAYSLGVSEGVSDLLLAEWDYSQPGLTDRLSRSALSARERGWRWVHEFEEAAATLAVAGIPSGAMSAAAEICERFSRQARPEPLDAAAAAAAAEILQAGEPGAQRT